MCRFPSATRAPLGYARFIAWQSAHATLAESRSWRLRATVAAPGVGDVGAVPPAAAQRLEQRCGIGKPARLRLHEIDAGLLIGLLRVEQREIARLAELYAAAREVEASARRSVMAPPPSLGGMGLRPARGARLLVARELLDRHRQDDED